MGGRPKRGHRLLPHTADLIVSAWAPTVEECIGESVYGLVGSFADVAGVAPRDSVPFSAEPADAGELLVQVLEEVIYLLDARGMLPVRVTLARTADGGLTGEFRVVPASAAGPTGAVPKAVSRHGLRFERDGPVWRCEVAVDV